jgi:hypothetical protein
MPAAGPARNRDIAPQSFAYWRMRLTRVFRSARRFSTFLRDLPNSCVSSTTRESGLRHSSEMVWDFVAGYSLVVVTSLLSSWRNLPPKGPRTSCVRRNIYALEDVRECSANSMVRAQAAKRSNSLLRSRILTAAHVCPKPGTRNRIDGNPFGQQTLSRMASTSTMKVQADFPRAAAVKSEWLPNRIHLPKRRSPEQQRPNSIHCQASS